jgi:hypothetical protein
MTIFIIVVWTATAAAAFVAGYKLRKPIEKTQDNLKASAKDLAHKAADRVVDSVRDAEGKVK